MLQLLFNKRAKPTNSSIRCPSWSFVGAGQVASRKVLQTALHVQSLESTGGELSHGPLSQNHRSFIVANSSLRRLETGQHDDQHAVTSLAERWQHSTFTSGFALGNKCCRELSEGCERFVQFPSISRFQSLHGSWPPHSSGSCYLSSVLNNAQVSTISSERLVAELCMKTDSRPSTLHVLLEYGPNTSKYNFLGMRPHRKIAGCKTNNPSKVEC